MAINSRPYRGRPPCVHCGFCHGFVCEVRAKASTLTTVIPEAEATGRCEVRPESYVFRIDTNPQGRATGVAFFDRAGANVSSAPRAVVVCANGAETPRLLLMSANSRFPNGLANASGLVGKYLMFNYSSRALGVFEHELNEYKSVQVTRILHDFYDCGSEARSLRRRRTRRSHRAAADDLGDPHRVRGPVVGRGLQGAAEGVPAQHAGGVSWHVARRGESNNVTLDPELKDAWGLPAIRVTYRDHPDDLANARFLQDRGAEILDAAGRAASDQGAGRTESTSAVHLLGTCRMGERSGHLGDRQVSPQPRGPEPVHLRRQQPRHLGTRPADDDDSGAGVPRR